MHRHPAHAPRETRGSSCCLLQVWQRRPDSTTEGERAGLGAGGAAAWELEGPVAAAALALYTDFSTRYRAASV